MTSISRNTGHTLLFVFAVSYALLVAWCIFFPSDETEGDILLYHGGQGYEMQRPSVSPVQFSPSASAPSFAGGSAPRKFRLRGSSYGGGGSYQGGYAFSSRAFSPAGAGATGGLYTTSSAQVHSYGGGSTEIPRDTKALQSSQTETSALPPYPLLSLRTPTESVYMPITTETSSTNTLEEAAIYSSMAHCSYGWGSMPSYAMHTIPTHSVGKTYTADQRLAYANHSSMRKIGGGSVEDAWIRWFEKLYGEETLLTIDQLKSLYAQLTDNGDYPTLTWEDFLSWFNQKQGNEDFQWTLPVGDGASTLVVLTLLYVLYKVIRTAHIKQDI